MTAVLAFVVAIGILVAIHEWGHFAVARHCGVRVLRFSVGFGPQIAGWTSKVTGTQFVVGLLPFGGYVKMLDEREGPVAPAELSEAFNNQTVGKRAAIVAAGPAANLVLAIILYALVNWAGVEQPLARVGHPIDRSVAANAGFFGQETIQEVAFEGDAPSPVASFEEFRWWLTRAALGKRDLVVYYTSATHPSRQTVLRMGELEGYQADANLFRKIGFIGPYSPAVIGELSPQGAAQSAGLLSGDLVLQVDRAPIFDAGQLRELIRASGRTGSTAVQDWLVERSGSRMHIPVQPKAEIDGAEPIGRVGAVIGMPPAMTTVRYGLIDGADRALTRTVEVSILTLRMMWQMVTGDASIKNLSGPITIADYAGKSASLGLGQFAVFLALISISLGVLNLLPLPVLDGGHLMYYLWESVVGRPVSDVWEGRLQKVGFALLMVMMSVAVFNDISRLWG